MLLEYLARLGLSDKERTLYQTLASIGIQPASILGKRLNMDRVVTYKHLKKLATQGLVKIYIRDGIQYFGTTGAEGMASYLQEQSAEIEELSVQIPQIRQELQGLSHGEGFVPKVQVFEGKSGMKSLMRDLLFEAKKEGIMRIRMLTSNTFDQQMGSVRLSAFMDEFFGEARKRSLAVDILEASGTLLPEYIRHIDPRHFDPKDFPATRGATNVFLVGTALYLACYGDSQIGLKVKQEQMSQIFHFFFDTISRNVPLPDSRPPVKVESWLRK
jgi:hypothetical protein